MAHRLAQKTMMRKTLACYEPFVEAGGPGVREVRCD